MSVLNHGAMNAQSRNKPNLKEIDTFRNSIKNLTIFYHKYTDKTDEILANI